MQKSYRVDGVNITFGMIVLNGEPFIRYNLRALYPFAHQIIVVEGAGPSAKDSATIAGHSLDDTLASLRSFKNEEDPGNKLIIVTAEDEGHPDGFWSEKDEMSRAFAKRATGNYLWQVVTDEFYFEKDMKRIIGILSSGADMVSFRMIAFWGGLKYMVDSFWLIWFRVHNYDRLFAWGKGYEYTKHRPPTVTDEQGKDLRLKRHITAEQMKDKGILLYHYSLLFPKQVERKAAYYSGLRPYHFEEEGLWEKECYRVLSRPFRVHNNYKHISWLKRYRGPHPEQVMKMMDDIDSGVIKVESRDNRDVELLLRNPLYVIAGWFLEIGSSSLRF